MRPRIAWLSGPVGPMDRDFFRVGVLEDKDRREWLLRRGEKGEREFVSSEVD